MKLTPWSKFLTEKPLVAKLAKKIPTLKKPEDPSPSSENSIIVPYPESLIGFTTGLFPAVNPSKYTTVMCHGLGLNL
jgi:hypothetical protein